MTIKEKYDLARTTPSDINEHVPVLFLYGLQCDHITEMGVCTVVSTWGLLAARPPKMVSYDIIRHPNVTEAEILARTEGIDYKFVLADVLRVDIEETDLLFIDTFHHALQIKRELARHAGKVRKYIIFHDTELYGNTNESMHHTAREANEKNGVDVSEYDLYNFQGIMPEIKKFVTSNPEWSFEKVLTNNNGLTIIKRTPIQRG